MPRQPGSRLPTRPRTRRADSTRQSQAFARARPSGISIAERGAVDDGIFANGLLEILDTPTEPQP